uniref:Uncharacterized protein n=1 Tax=Anguilla anguilla TaxID=7936 RepID=A0A0E9WV77_ANGAN
MNTAELINWELLHLQCGLFVWLSPAFLYLCVGVAGAASRRLEVLLRLVYRGLSVAKKGLWSLLFQRALLAAFLLYLILVRLDPALPPSFPWISRLLRILRQMWDTMFAPYYQASSMS